MNGHYLSVNKLKTTVDVILFTDNENKVPIRRLCCYREFAETSQPNLCHTLNPVCGV